MSEHVCLKNTADGAVLPTWEQEGKPNSRAQDFLLPSPSQQLRPPTGHPGAGMESNNCGKIVQGRAVQSRHL